MLPIGAELRNGDFRVERQLGAGGFGNTYVVRNTVFDERFAMKEFFMKGINLRDGQKVTVSVPDNHTSFDGQREKFKKEALRLRKLRNPHIVQVHDLFEENGTVYYVMDYIDGQSLSDTLKQRGKPLPEAEVRRILPQVLEALETVHQQNIWHLDIKPGNIMVDSQGRAYLIDFGASKQMRGADGVSQATSSALCYTPGYAPMEQVEQAMDKFGPWTDFYALGATLFTLLTNQLPPSLTGINEEGAFIYPQPVSQQMQDLIKWMMSLARAKRPQSVAQIRQYLEGNMATEPAQPKSTETVVSQKTVVNQQTATDDSQATVLNSQNRQQQEQPEEVTTALKRGFWARLWLGDGQRKRNYLTTFFLCLFALLAVISVCGGAIAGYFGLLEAIDSSVGVMWSSFVSHGGPALIAGLGVLMGIYGLICWRRSAFWLMLLVHVLNSVFMIPRMEVCLAVSVISLLVDLLILLCMQLPGRPAKGLPKQRGWIQCKPAPVAKWIVLPLLVVWTLILLIVPPIIGARAGFSYSLYERGFKVVSSDCGNYRASESLATYYLDHMTYCDPYEQSEAELSRINRPKARFYLNRYFRQKPSSVHEYAEEYNRRWLNWLQNH